VRELLKHLPKGHREKSTWQHVAAYLDEAARGGSIIDVTVPLQMERVSRRFQPPWLSNQ